MHSSNVNRFLILYPACDFDALARADATRFARPPRVVAGSSGPDWGSAHLTCPRWHARAELAGLRDNCHSMNKHGA
jgi:hypothetical protein